MVTYIQGYFSVKKMYKDISLGYDYAKHFNKAYWLYRYPTGYWPILLTSNLFKQM